MPVQNKVRINELTLLNWNANGIRTKRSSFVAFLVSHNIDIACVTETHLLPNEVLKIPGYIVYRKDRVSDTASGGVAIMIKKKINHYSVLIPDFHGFETVGIKIQCYDGNSFLLYSAYKPPRYRLNSNHIELLLTDGTPTLLLGDLNSKHTNWGCRVTNPNGRRLYEVVTKHNIQVLAPAEPTYFSNNPKIQPDILDIGIHKNLQPPTFVTTLAELDSDHCPVLIKFQLPPYILRPTPRLINGFVQWNNFQTLLDSELTTAYHVENSSDIDEAVSHFTNVICHCVRMSTTNQVHQKSRNKLPQFIINLIREKNSIRRKWQRTRQPWLRKKLNDLIRLVKSELEQYQLSIYRTQIANISPGDNTLWRATKSVLQKPTFIPKIKFNNEVFTDPIDKCNAFANHYESVFTPNTNTPQHTINRIENYLRAEKSKATVNHKIKPTSPRELFRIIQRLPNKKSPGHDLIPNIVLKKLTKKALSYLTAIINGSIRTGYFPKTWKLADVIVFPKPGKSSHLPASYRPISLLPTLSKVLEKVILWRVTKYLSHDDIIPAFQFGFRAKHSTNHQLLRLSQSIIHGFERKQHTAAVFLDVAQAFDRVWHTGLVLKLHRISLPNYLIQLIQNFLTNRQFTVRIGNIKSELKPIKAGVPQGSILAPILFNIYCYDIPDVSPSNLAMYADDTVIFYSHSSIEEASNSIQLSVTRLSQWFTTWRISVNAAKTEAKIFSLKRFNNPPPLHINRERITWLPTNQPVKYLGVLMDTKLSWKSHITRTASLGTARVFQLYPLLNRRSTLSIESSILLFKSLIRPAITYAAPVWGSASKTHIHLLQVIQNKVLRTITNAPWFVRNDQLHKELGILPIYRYIRNISKPFFEKLHLVPGAVKYRIGVKTCQPTRLKRRLPQDLLLSETSSDEI